MGSFLGCDTSPSPPEQAAPPPPAPQAAKLVVVDVAWPDPARLDRAAAGALDARAAEGVRRSRVPVLLPARRDMLAVTKVIAKEHWTVASARVPGATVTVTASRAARAVPGIERAEGRRAIRGTRGNVTQNEGIWSAAWTENGAAYSVEVECDSPGAGPCADDAFVMRLADGLVYVGGAGAEEVAR